MQQGSEAVSQGEVSMRTRRVTISLLCLVFALGVVSTSLTGGVSVIGAQAATFSVYLPTLVKPPETLPPLPSNLEAVNTLGGNITSVAVAGRFAYIGEGAGLSVIDVNDSARPTLVGRLPLALRSYISEIVVSGTRAYMAAGKEGLLIADIAEPTAPRLIGQFVPPTIVSGVRVVGTKAYLAASSGGLLVVDVSDAAAPRLADSLATTGPARKVRYLDNIVYVITTRGDLLMVDATSLALLGKLTSPTYTSYTDIWVVGTIAYAIYGETSLQPTSLSTSITPQIAPGPTYRTGLHIIDIANPAQPALRGAVELRDGYFPETIYLVGTTVYVARGSSLGAFDVQNLEAPSYLGSAFDASYIPGQVNNIQINNNLLYAAAGSSFAIGQLDGVNQSPSVVLGKYTSPWFFDVIKQGGNRLYTSTRVYDVSDPANPAGLTSQPLSRLYYERDIEVAGVIVYTVSSIGVSGLGSLVISNANNARSPSLASRLNDVSALGVEVAGNLLYLSGGRGLQVFDVSKPGAPKMLAGGSESLEAATGLAVVGDRAYVAHKQQGLQVYDISTPSAPALIGTVALPGEPLDVVASNGFAYVSGKGTGVQILDLANPDAPRLVSSVESDVWVLGETVANGRLYMSNYLGLRVYDVSNPANPRFALGYDTPGEIADLAVVDDLLYMVDTYGGLQILRVN